MAGLLPQPRQKGDILIELLWGHSHGVPTHAGFDYEGFIGGCNLPLPENGLFRTNTLVLKLDGDKLTGKMSAPGRGGGPATDTDITDGKITGSDVSFSVVRDFGGNSMTTKYSGTVTNGSIKGKIEMDMGGNPTSRDWEAKLQK